MIPIEDILSSPDPGDKIKEILATENGEQILLGAIISECIKRDIPLNDTFNISDIGTRVSRLKSDNDYDTMLRLLVDAPIQQTITSNNPLSLSLFSSGEFDYQKKIAADIGSPPNGRNASDSFGASVTIYGDTVVIGATGHSYNSAGDLGSFLASAGAVFVYTRSGSTWSLQQKIAADLGSPLNGRDGSDNFGFSVSLYEDTLVVGSHRNGYDASGGGYVPTAGAVFVYTRSGSTWSLQQKITADLGSPPNGRQSGDNFGESVSIYEDTIVVGANGHDYNSAGDLGSILAGAGAVFVYTRSGSTWSLQQKIAADLGMSARVLSGSFGASVSLYEDTIVVGQIGDDTDSSGSNIALNAGAAFVYTRSGSTWSLQKKLAGDIGSPSNGRKAGDNFGSSVSIYEDTIAVGANNQGYDTSGGDFQSSAGAVYIYTRSGSTWSFQQKITEEYGAPTNERQSSDQMGTSVALYGDTLAVGSPFHDYDSTGTLSGFVSGAGAVFVYTRSGSTWSFLQKIAADLGSQPNSRESNDIFGFDLALYNGTLVSSASAQDYDSTGDIGSLLSTAGAVFVYLGDVTETTGACCFEDGTCQSLTEADCISQGGSYQGDGTSCSAVDCLGTKPEIPPFGCEFGDCPPCDPETCDPQCCCCHSVDIVSQARVSCHKKVVLSCNKDATAPGPGLDAFPAECNECRSACETVLGIGSHAGLSCDDLISTGTGEGWWSFPPAFAPCECNCQQINGSACELTCVTCAGLYCESEVTVTGSDCNYHVSLLPGEGCCGSPSKVDWMFVVDYSAAMGSDIAHVRSEIESLAQNIVDKGVDARFGLTVFGYEPESNIPTVLLPFTSSLTELSDAISIIPVGGIYEYDIQAAFVAAAETWEGTANYLMLIGKNETHYPDENAKSVSDVVSLCMQKNITVFVVDNNTSTDRTSLAYQTGGQQFDIASAFGDVSDSVALNLFPSDCRCMDSTAIPVRRSSPECMCCKDGITDPCVDDPFDSECIDNLPSHCFDIPVKKCLPGDENCDCTQPIALNACGTTIVITPVETHQVCCSEIGFGCDCPDKSGPPACCGPTCEGSEICQNGIRLYSSLKEAQDAVWCECFQKAAFVDESTPNCTDCCCPNIEANPGDPSYPCDQLASDDPLLQENPPRCCDCPSAHASDCCNCCLHFADGAGGFTLVKCRSEVDAEVEAIWNACGTGAQPPPEWQPVNRLCQIDKCIVGTPSGPVSGDRCGDANGGCVSVRHPSVVVLNNGVGLVAYESTGDTSVIKIQQFKTSVLNKILPNREFNYGRLQNNIRWSGGKGKLYYFEDPPSHLINGNSSVDISNPSSWKDGIGFRSGPLANQVFPVSSPPLGEDDIGKYVSFIVPTSTSLSSNFPSSDDVYNVQWFIFDFEDTGVIGDMTETTTDGAAYNILGRQAVDDALLLPQHLFNGEPAPVAFPSIASARNYSNALENSQFVYLTYQAFESGKWNIYLRQLRLSEYERQDQIQDAITNDNIVSLQEAGIGNVVYRIICTNDKCYSVAERYNLKRSIVLEVLTTDGRDVLNRGLSGFWPSLCDGYPATNFPKSKVYIQFAHSVIADRCPDSEMYDEFFSNWQTGQTFNAPFGSFAASALYGLLRIPNDQSVSIGDFDPPVIVDGVSVYSSSVGAVWYQSTDESEWSVLNDTAANTLTSFKGFDVSEPILLTPSHTGHSTRSKVLVNYNNDVFVAYENTDSGIHQVCLIGTNTPGSSLPDGIATARQVDSSLNYFFKYADFSYSRRITSDGVNQLPDMFIDLNDVIHITWQSSVDQRWEIYYANSESDFNLVRITDDHNKSLRPNISGDRNGNIYIVWHDSRFGNYEIMMAYYLGERIWPLSQQDTYLSSVRNGYSHYDNRVSLTITNSETTTVCYSNFIVNVYSDRLLSNRVLSVSENQWPFAFEIPSATQDETTQHFVDLSDWLEDSTTSGDEITITLTGPEYDSSLNRSTIHDIYVSVTDASSIEVSFRGSDSSSDPLADSQWTAYADVSSLDQEVLYSSLGLFVVRGRYKQSRIRLTYNVTSYSPSVQRFSITSASPRRLCLSPGETATLYLDMNPSIRIDALGAGTSEFPLPVQLSKNTTYFVSLDAVNDQDESTTMPDQLASISCSTCSTKFGSWNYETCSLQIDILNDSDSTKFFNIKVSFYYDREKTRKIADFMAFPSHADLAYFTTGNGRPAADDWEINGLKVKSGEYAHTVLWPSLSPTAGLLCGVTYFVDIFYCAGNEPDSACSSGDLSLYSSGTEWKCNCLSPRAEEFDHPPVSLRDIVRWKSSAFGFSDTRLTETVHNNLNPIVRIRSNLDGIVLYESNRDQTYKAYASAFSIQPDQNMYASGAQSINTSFSQVNYKSDIPVCSKTSSTQTDCNTLVGRNISAEIDQYDGLFLAIETPFDENKCSEFSQNQQSSITVHTCGVDSLKFTEEQSDDTVVAPCNPQTLTQTTFFERPSPTFAQIIRQIRVRNEFVKYHINRNGVTCPVVDACDIGFTIVGTPESTAVRLRNGQRGDWSTWLPFGPEIGENTIDISWKLSQASGVKSVEFQVLTYAGITVVNSLYIIADYRKVPYILNLYRPLADTPVPNESVDLSVEAIWAESNQLSLFDSIPVATLRPPTVQDGNLVELSQDYIFVEIIPDAEYMRQFSGISDTSKSSGDANIEPVFDFIQQGAQDQYNVPTKWFRNAQGIEVFRGVITIGKENQSSFKDGLASIVPRFKNDCSDATVITTDTTGFAKDSYNVSVTGGSADSSVVRDAWSTERDSLGNIRYPVVIRGSEDPYFIFGDPNYRLNE